jgi:transmembrane sensor
MSEGALPRGGLRQEASARSDPASQAMDDGTPLPQAMVDAAIQWAIQLRYSGEAQPASREAFERWLQADALHARAWQRVDSLRQPFAGVPAELLRNTLHAADARRDQRLLARRHAVKLLSVAGVALGTGWLAREQLPWQRLVAQASTVTGAQKTLRLSDGSVIVLNTDSAVSTVWSEARRQVVLHRGEIQITTGADGGSSRRPFWVETPFGRMQALGTRFVVRLYEDRARVAVQEGAVALHPAQGDPAALVVRAGESGWLAPQRATHAPAQDFEADAWTDGVIAGRNMRLADLLAEIARYRVGHLGCDARVADLRVSGLFHVRDTDQALQFLVQTQPVSVTMRTRFWVSVGPE